MIKQLAFVAVLASATACSPSRPSSNQGPHSDISMLELARVSGTHHLSNLVQVPHGYEAASWTQGKTEVVGGRKHRYRETPVGHVYFWRASRVSWDWTRIGASTYPAYAAPPGQCRPTINGDRVAGGSDAVFIVYPCITGDGVLNAVAYANGTHGWGLVQALKDGGVASLGHRTVITRYFMRPGSAAHYELEFRDHQLVTVDRTGYFSDAGDGLYPRMTYWRWQSGELQTTRSDGFTARAAPRPVFAVGTLPRAGCPATGTFAVAFAPHFGWLNGHGPDQPFDLTIAALHRPIRSGYCIARVAADTPMVVQVGHVTNGYAVHPGPITGQKWVTAPAWMLLIHTLGFHAGDRIPLIVGPDALRTSPYIVPPQLHSNVMLVHGGGVVTKHHPAKLRRMARGLVTFLRGKVVRLAVRP